MYKLEKACCLTILFITGVLGTASAHAAHQDITGITRHVIDSRIQSGDAQGYINPWIYVLIKDEGTYSLREVLDEGTPGWYAFASSGHALEDYEPTPVFTNNALIRENGIVLLTRSEYCLGDMNGDGIVNAGDIVLFTLAYLDEDPIADLSGNGVIDVFDQIIFLKLVSLGCVEV